MSVVTHTLDHEKHTLTAEASGFQWHNCWFLVLGFTSSIAATFWNGWRNSGTDFQGPVGKGGLRDIFFDIQF